MSDTEPNPLAPQDGISPLAEADTDSVNLLISERINKIMNTPPLDLSDEDLAITVAYYRKERARFIIESQNKTTRPKAPPGQGKPKGPPPTSVADAIKAAQALGDMF
jgi:hypothetical protein